MVVVHEANGHWPHATHYSLRLTICDNGFIHINHAIHSTWSGWISACWGPNTTEPCSPPHHWLYPSSTASNLSWWRFFGLFHLIIILFLLAHISHDQAPFIALYEAWRRWISVVSLIWTTSFSLSERARITQSTSYRYYNERMERRVSLCIPLAITEGCRQTTKTGKYHLAYA